MTTTNETLFDMLAAYEGRVCSNCAGRGYIWLNPYRREGRVPCAFLGDPRRHPERSTTEAPHA